MKIEVKSIEFNTENSTAVMVLSVNGNGDQKCIVEVINLTALIEKTVNNVFRAALNEANL